MEVFFVSPSHLPCNLSGEMDFCAYEAVSLTCYDSAYRTCHGFGLLTLFLEQRCVVMAIAWVGSHPVHESDGLSREETLSLRFHHTAHLGVFGLCHPSSNQANGSVVAPRPGSRLSLCCVVALTPRDLDTPSLVNSTAFSRLRLSLTHFPTPHRLALFCIQRPATGLSIEELDKSVGLLYGNLGKLAVLIETVEYIPLGDLFGGKVAWEDC